MTDAILRPGLVTWADGGVLCPDEVAATAATIAAAQLPDGRIPWYTGGHTDPWDHVEAAMGLDVAGLPAAAEAGYRWLAASQNPDGSWYSAYDSTGVADATRESNFAAYLAVGLWHHHLCTGDDTLLADLWPTLVAAVRFVLDLQTPTGQVRWARSATGDAADEALLAGCSSVYQGLRCACAVADRLGRPQAEWDLAAETLRTAVLAGDDGFTPRGRYAMDWYYPVLGGALRGRPGACRIDERWDRFVVPGLGVRCVADQPWVTGAETCELVLSLWSLGQVACATEQFRAVQHLRHADGSYWTGYVYPDDTIWPQERTTWTAGAVLLAAAALGGEPATTAVFRAGTR